MMEAPPVTPVKQAGKSEKLTIPPSPFLKKLGYGSGVSVLQMLRSPKAGSVRSPWALKMINKKRKPPKAYEKRLQTEAEILKKLSHPNIVGFRIYDKTKKCIGMEKCDSALRDMIEERIEDGAAPYEAENILKVVLDIGKALDYLHTQANLLHGDMKSGNILINGNFEICKLCDFGVSLNLDENGYFDKTKNKNISYQGTELWAAPETIHGTHPISSKADLFSFGLVLWEMMSLAIPHMPSTDDDADESVVCLDDESLPVTAGTRPPIPFNINEIIYKDPIALFYCLTEEIPAKRPTAHHIVLCAQHMLGQ